MIGLATCLLCAAGFGDAEGAESNWGTFRGPNGSGIAREGRLPEALDPEGNLIWRTPVPPGYSSPVLSEELVLFTASEDGKPVTLGIDRYSGEQAWAVAAPAERESGASRVNTPASPTPATDGERVIAFFDSFGLVCYDLEGEELWRKPLGPFNVPHGMSTSPVLAGDLVLLQCDQDTDAYLLAVDKRTGEERWRTPRPEVLHSYSTPTVHLPEEGPGIVILAGSYQTSAYSLENGEKLWWAEGMAWQSNCLPVVGDGVVYVLSAMGTMEEYGTPELAATWKAELAERDADGDGRLSTEEWPDPILQQVWFIVDIENDGFLDEKDWNTAKRRGKATGGLFAIRLGGRGDVTDTHVAWSYTKRRGLPNFTSPVLYDGVLYMVKDGSLLTALDAQSGEVLEQGRAGESDGYFASPIAADGKVVLASVGGRLHVVRAGRDWELLSEADLGEEIWSTPAIGAGQVFVRTQEALYCFEDVE